MLAIEKFLKEEDLKLDILGHSELENIKEEKGKIRKFLELMKKENFETYEIDVIDEALTINEFNYFGNMY
jgi:triosephosphate isomerase